MKNLILTMALTGFAFANGYAQSGESKFAKNYPVCLSGDKYHVCNQSAAMTPDIGRTTEVNTVYGMQNTYVHMGYGTTGNPRYRGNIRVTYDEPGAVYEGKETMVNDGVRKNKKRNLNTNNGAYDLPPNDGGSGR
ncbi:MAG TPA: hypothetical protein PL009_07570 [Flavipsychrobacter sp.]|nr:hypothetical protein [Flavipsychrobacter sp.]